ncbi:MAG: hypothetical protein ABFS32_19955 [Bacteroidota bacterium]
MNYFKLTTVLLTIFAISSAFASNPAQQKYDTLTQLQGEWKLAHADKQEGGATKKGPAAKIIGTNKTAISFKVIGRGSTLQENLLPGTPKEMATMYHCDDFDNCGKIKAKHYCAKQNQPELILDAEKSSDKKVVMSCDMSTSLCNSSEGHVHRITHELSEDKNNLKTTYSIYKDGMHKKDSVYHFSRK